MKLLPLLITVIATSTVSGRSVDDLLEHEVSPSLTEEENMEENVAGSATSQTGALTNDLSDSYRSVYGQVLEDTVFAKSFLDRIIAGSVAKHGEFPWQASVTRFEFNQFAHFCGAVIINEFWLLGAAHCYEDHPSQLWITVGEYNLDSVDEGQQTFEVDRIYSHENYNTAETADLDFDIAMIRIKPSRDGRGIIFNKFVQSISLPDSTLTLREGTKLVVSGWGGILPSRDCEKEPQVYPVKLKTATVYFVGQDSCKHLLSPYTITEQMLCAGPLCGRDGICMGDSGGPLVYKTAGSNVLVGIASWVRGCGQPSYPDVYARVSSVLPWIANTMKTSNSLQYHSIEV